MLLFEFFEEQVRCFAVSKSLVRIAWIGNKNRKRGIFSVQVLFVQTLTQCCNTDIQVWIKIATQGYILLFVFVFLNSLRRMKVYSWFDESSFKTANDTTWYTTSSNTTLQDQYIWEKKLLPPFLPLKFMANDQFIIAISSILLSAFSRMSIWHPRVIWMFTFCLDNLDNLCKLRN